MKLYDPFQQHIPISLFPGSTSLGIIPSLYLNVFCEKKGKLHLLLPCHVKKSQKSGLRKFCSNLRISQTCLMSVKVQFLCASFHSRVLKFLSQSQILNKGCGTLGSPRFPPSPGPQICIWLVADYFQPEASRMQFNHVFFCCCFLRNILI